MQFFNDLGKYRTLVVAIALFIVFDASVLGLNYYIAEKFAEDTATVNLAARQRTLSQRVVKSVLQADNALGTGGDVKPGFEELEYTYNLFDSTLKAFTHGGEIEGVDGSTALVEPIVTPEGRQILKNSQATWSLYQEVLRPVLELDGPVYEENSTGVIFLTPAGESFEGDIYEAIEVTSEQSLTLLGHMNDLTVHLENRTRERVKRLRLIQFIGIAFAVFSFFVIMFHFVKNLRRSDVLVEHARRDTDTILETVGEGLFLLDKDLNIGQRHSASLPRIFRKKKLAGENFGRILKGIVPQKTLNVSKDFIEVLFGARANPNLIKSLNPLSEVEVHFDDQEGSFETRVLGFEFQRVQHGAGDQPYLLVSVNDITENVRLSRKLQESQEQSEAQLALLLDILHVEPETLTDFLSNAQRSMAEVNGILRKPGRDAATYRAKLNGIFRHVHSLKGEAGALGLSAVEIKTHEFEDLIQELRDSGNEVTGNDFLPLTVRLDGIIEQLNGMAELVAKMIDFRMAIEKSDLIKLQPKRHESPSLKSQFAPVATIPPGSQLPTDGPHYKGPSPDDKANETTPDTKPVDTEPTAEAEPEPANVESTDAGFNTEEPEAVVDFPIDTPADVSTDVSTDAPVEMLTETPESHALSLADDTAPATAEAASEPEADTNHPEHQANRIIDLPTESDEQSLSLVDASEATNVAEPSAEETPADVMAAEPDAQVSSGRGTVGLLEKLVTRIANESGKKVVFWCDGLSEERVPAQYRQAIKDISVQFLRNSVVHGIENPGDREDAGKSPEGSLVLRFNKLSESAGFELSCRDDGRGLSASRIREVAIKKGLLAPEKAAAVDEPRLMGLIFHPGFSTAEQVTKHSGRGVGMDMVRCLVKELNGSVRIATKEGKFTQLKVLLPPASAQDGVEEAAA